MRRQAQPRATGRRGSHPGRPLAVVMGGWDIVRPLTQAGIRCAVFAPPHDPVHKSRLVAGSLPFADLWREPEVAVRALLRFAADIPVKPVLFPPDDQSLMLASRHREALGRSFHLPLADAALVEDLFDKARFTELADRLDLPVPRTRRLATSEGLPDDVRLSFPLVIKPVSRGRPWVRSQTLAKALQVSDMAALRRLWPELAALGVDVLAQEAVPGPESRIESFHAYVDRGGMVAGAFTGRKIRTWPARYGESSAVVITDASDVDELGRQTLSRLGLRGPVKLDFERAPSGELYLLEVNPRFNLWHLPGAVAGVNLPALAFAEHVGERPPPAARARPGVRWCDPRYDVRSARADGIALTEWLRWAATCETTSNFAWDDPLPYMATYVGPALARRAFGLPRTLLRIRSAAMSR